VLLSYPFNSSNPSIIVNYENEKKDQYFTEPYDLLIAEANEELSISANPVTNFAFLRPFAEGKEKWTYKQITAGGVEKAIENELKPLFSMASTIYGEALIEPDAMAHQNLSYMDKLQYPPLFKMK